MSDGWLMEAADAALDEGHRLAFECAACRERFDEDDLEQVQPDGRYACPLGCSGEIDTRPLFMVIPMRGPSSLPSGHDPCPVCGDTDDPGYVIWPTTGCLTRCDECGGTGEVDVAPEAPA